METAERERDRLAVSPPASPASNSSPASPHVVVYVAEEQDAAPTPAPRRLVPPPPPPPPPPRTPTPQRDGAASTTSSTPDSDSDEKPAGKASPPTSPARPATSPHVFLDVGEDHEPDPTPAVDDSAPTPTTPEASPSPAPPRTPTANEVPGDKVSTAPLIPPPPPTTSTASEVSSSSAANRILHTSSTISELFEDEDSGFKLRIIELTSREQALEEEIKLAKKLHNDYEIKRRNQEITLRQWGVQLDTLEDEISTREHEVRMAELRDRQKRLKDRDDALNKPLLQQEEQKKHNKDDNTWDKRQNMMAIGLACWLSALISMQPLFPPDYVSYIVGVFAIMWVLGTVAFPVGLFGASRIEKDFSRHISRLTFLSFALFGLYILYIISQPPAPSSSGLAPSPAPLQPPQESTFDGRTWFYFVLGFVALCGHVASWVLGCRTGSDRDL